jgi:hypothetical protein
VAPIRNTVAAKPTKLFAPQSPADSIQEDPTFLGLFPLLVVRALRIAGVSGSKGFGTVVIRPAFPLAFPCSSITSEWPASLNTLMAQ